MTIINEFGAPPIAFDYMKFIGATAPVFQSSVIDASTEKFAFIGQIWHPTRPAGTFAIRKVLFLTGAITFNVLSTVRVSLQDVSQTAGPPYQPDGTQDQTYDFSLGIGLSANTWTTTGNLSADRTVSQGDRFCVVFEFQTFTALDAINIQSVDNAAVAPLHYLSGNPALNTGSYALVANAINNVAFECSDGTNAFFMGSPCYTATSNISVGTGATARRSGNLFTVATSRAIDTIGLYMNTPNGADGTINLYDGNGTTVLVSQSVDNDAIAAQGSARYAIATFAPIMLSTATNYRCAFVSTTATTASVRVADVASAALLDSQPFGQQCMYTEYDGANWAQTATRRAFMAMGLSGTNDGTGGSGGPVGTNFRGGFSN